MGKSGTTPHALRRLKPGLSLKQLSRRTGLALTHLSRVVNGRRGLTVRVAALIALSTGQTLDRVVSVLAPTGGHLHVDGHKPRKKTV